MVDNSRRSIKGTDDSVITFPDRVDTSDSSPDNKVAKSRSRVRGMEDPVITYQNKVDTPDSKIAGRLMETQRVEGPHHLKSILEMSRKEERSFSQAVLLHYFLLTESGEFLQEASLVLLTFLLYKSLYYVAVHFSGCAKN
ncbi:hypothetical protein TNIN_251531 [Trichonephila inaurata madagascariensis]|uniref:Uncharacterized protein n=1 Tax=Trichonephila inaurata madagascariensis TaxID=2747483 RepID=A0A8X7CT59_9ARAC|nr:hypothetical protein TNIN_251531 [Trichonephila inaurata madagascariensis]